MRCVVLLVCAAFTARADVKLHGLFSDNMVLQQGASAPVWGWAEEGEAVTVQFRGQQVKTKAKDGRWLVRLKKLKAGGPDDLIVNGKNSLTLKNVLVGEVWVCSGQSNMEWPLRASFDADKEVAATANSMLRLYTVPKLKAKEPVNDVKASWQECNPQTTPGFSAVAYYFGRDLAKARGVPVGLIHTSWGGSPAEVWMSQEVLEAKHKKAILDDYAVSWKKYEDALAKFQREQEGLKKEGKEAKGKAPSPPYWKPTELYNGMIAPLIPFAIKGAIWYQGESNAGRAHQYRTLYPDMINNWRRDWGQGDFPFFAVQLAPFKKIQEQPGESDWAELREAQNYAMQVLSKVGVAVITDVGDEKDIHPKQKEPVGARLALAARGIAYGEKIVYSGPAYKSVSFKEDKAIISFNHVGKGLDDRDVAASSKIGENQSVLGLDGKVHGGRTVRLWDAAKGKELIRLAGFTIAGEDKKFVWANAEISGDKVVVSSPQVARPVAVRFGWADYPVVDFWNKDGLPASPFRTDNFPMITAPKN